MSLHAVSTFTGVGGIDLAFERVGVPGLLMCESDKAAQSVLAHHFPGIPIHDDVRELTGDDLRAAGAVPDRTVLHGGFPCQDVSVAGRRHGMGRGTRSGMFWELDRLLAEFAPRWVVLENVPGLLSSHGGGDMGAVLGALADRGYGFAYRVLDAQHLGVPQRRRRVVIVGRLGDSGAAPAQVLFDAPSGGRDSATLGEAGETTAGGAAGGAGLPRVSPTRTAHHGRGNGADEAHIIAFDPKAGGDRTSSGAFEAGTGITPTLSGSRPHAVSVMGHGVYQKVIRSGERDRHGNLPPEVWERRDTAATLSPFDLGSPSRAVDLVTTTTEVRRLTPLECERLQGFLDGWTEGQSDSTRYRQMGNAVAVPVFEWVARRLLAVDAEIRAA